jgi:hypothetical protein|tara:strand:+ start:2985 stop:4577 length:1593 start_codon:yes stop_codon:yes gene_type:complete
MNSRNNIPLPLLLTISLSFTLSCVERDSRAGNPQLRGMLFDSIMTLTMNREAFSPIKNLHWGIDPLDAMESYRDEVINADTEEKLFYALEKVSNARNDRHLDISLVENGIRLKESSGIDGGEGTVYSTPLKILPDYSDPSVYFVSDLSGNQSHFSSGTVAPGERIIAVNHMPIEQYEKSVRPYHPSSYRPNFRWRMAEDMTVKTANLPPIFYGDHLVLELEKLDGSSHTVQLPYLHPDSIPWQNISEPQYPGFKLEHSTPTYDLYLPLEDQGTVILTWYGFRDTMIADVDQLMEMAQDNSWLDFDIIIDGTRSRGGSAGAYAMQRFSPKPFKTTFGNIRISDVIPIFTQNKRSQVQSGGSLDSGVPEAMDDGSWLMDWLDNEVADSLNSGATYSNSVPFKLAHAPKDSDGILLPATQHFRGRMVAFFVPRRGSHLDQFAAIIKDNSIGHIIGMTAGGYSNTWEWEETIGFPGTDQPVIQFMWDIGHTIRPNGDILEGNPALPDELFILTRQNFDTYYKELLQKALEYLNG